MRKRIVQILLVFAIVVASLPDVYASGDVTPYASNYLNRYLVTLVSGDSSGEVVLSFSIRGMDKMSLLGVSKVEIYRSNGVHVTTIPGNTTNGLLGSSVAYHSGMYTYRGAAGASYYAVVTVYASNSSGSDSRIVTTNTAKAP